MPAQRRQSQVQAQTVQDIMRSSRSMQERLNFVISSIQGTSGSNRAREQLIAQKAQEGLVAMRAREKEYWHYVKKMKDEIEPNFKLPADAYVGTEPVQDKINRQVRAAQEKMAQTTKEYETWLAKNAEEHEERVKEKLQAKLVADKEYGAAREGAGRQRAIKLKQAKKKSKDTEDKYWQWLEEAKADVARRTSYPQQSTSAKSVDAYVQEKLAAAIPEQQARDAEYAEWLKAVSKPKFTLPYIKVDSVQERDRKIGEVAKRKAAVLAKTGAEYNKWVSDRKVEHEERLQEKVQAKFAADADFQRQREEDAAMLSGKFADAERMREEVAERSRNEVAAMYKKVKRRPLMIHENYLPAALQKRAAPRRLMAAMAQTQSLPALRVPQY